MIRIFRVVLVFTLYHAGFQTAVSALRTDLGPIRIFSVVVVFVPLSHGCLSAKHMDMSSVVLNRTYVYEQVMES